MPHSGVAAIIDRTKSLREVSKSKKATTFVGALTNRTDPRRCSSSIHGDVKTMRRVHKNSTLLNRQCNSPRRPIVKGSVGRMKACRIPHVLCVSYGYFAFISFNLGRNAVFLEDVRVLESEEVDHLKSQTRTRTRKIDAKTLVSQINVLAMSGNINQATSNRQMGCDGVCAWQASPYAAFHELQDYPSVTTS